MQVSVLTRHLHNTNQDLMHTQKHAEELETATLPRLFQTGTPKTFASQIPGFWQTGKAQRLGAKSIQRPLDQ